MATLTSGTVECVRCGHDECFVIDSRMKNIEGTTNIKARVRRRRCAKCFRTFGTYEIRASDLGKLNAEHNKLLETVRAMQSVFAKTSELSDGQMRAEYKDYAK